MVYIIRYKIQIKSWTDVAYFAGVITRDQFIYHYRLKILLLKIFLQEQFLSRINISFLITIWYFIVGLRAELIKFSIITSECSTGYYWVNCSRRCPYPLYGDLCDYACSCKRYLCDFQSGCPSTKGKYILYVVDYLWAFLNKTNGNTKESRYSIITRNIWNAVQTRHLVSFW